MRKIAKIIEGTDLPVPDLAILLRTRLDHYYPDEVIATLELYSGLQWVQHFCALFIAFLFF